jgi:methylated-DNA-protein-cysteine methyltransferase related protein
MEQEHIAEIIRAIPKGKVATYGQIAQMAGYPNGARLVVWTLNSQWKQGKQLPWFRLINAKGTISLPPGEGYNKQKQLLEKEGVVFGPGDKIDLKKYQWGGE